MESGSVSVAVAGRTCHWARAVLPGLILYDAVSLAVRADAAQKRARSAGPAPAVVRERGQAGLSHVGLNGIPRALPWA